MAARRLIVHGDDFGLSERVNEGIVHAHRQGILTSTSVIASGAAFEHAVAMARETPTLDLGVHLMLSGGQPVSRRSTVSTLLGRDGFFHSDAGTFAKRYFVGFVSLQEVERELDAQIAKVFASGLTISHLDGHQHLHMLPGIRGLVDKLATRYGIRCIRHPQEAPRLYMLRDISHFGRLLQLLVLDGFCVLSRSTDAKHCDYFSGFFYGGRLTATNLSRVLAHLPSEGTCELMCHPGEHDPSSRYSDWGYRWQEERDALTDKGIGAYLKAERVELISYADL